MECLKGLQQEASGVLNDFTSVVYPKNCLVLSDEQVTSVWGFVKSCQQFVVDSKAMLPYFSRNEEMSHVLLELETATTRAEKAILGGMLGNKPIVHAAAVGATAGMAFGIISLPFDFGALMAIGSIVGGIAAARTEAGHQSQEVKMLANDLEFIIQSIKTFKMFMVTSIKAE